MPSDCIPNADGSCIWCDRPVPVGLRRNCPSTPDALEAAAAWLAQRLAEKRHLGLAEVDQQTIAQRLAGCRGCRSFEHGYCTRGGCCAPELWLRRLVSIRGCPEWETKG
jgi:hypothetical protein